MTLVYDLVVLYFEDSGGGRKTLGLHVISNNGKLIVDGKTLTFY